MPINLSKINGALDRLNPESRSQNNNNTNTAVVKLEEGKSNIRIVPYVHDMEMPFQELHFHYGVGGKSFLCPKRMKNDDCPVCDMATEAWNDFTNTSDESSKEVFKKLVSTLRVFIPIVVRGEEDQVFVGGQFRLVQLTSRFSRLSRTLLVKVWILQIQLKVLI